MLGWVLSSKFALFLDRLLYPETCANMEEFSPTPMTTQPNARTMEPVTLNMVVLDRFSSLLSFHLLHSLKNTL